MRKMVIGSLTLIMVSLFIVGCSGCGKADTKDNLVKENSYDVLHMGAIPIGMWVTPPEKYRVSEYYELMKKCGINFVNGFSSYETNSDAIKQSLSLAEEQGLKFLVADQTVTALIEEYQKNPDEAILEKAMKQIEKYYQYPAYAGQLLIDEPGRAMFDNLIPFVETYSKNYPGKQWHVNMFPSYAEGGTGVPYEQYVDDWIEMVNPNYYSYDSYPLLVYDDDNPLARPEITDYYYNLDLLRSKTREKEIPLWSFIQTVGISGTQGVPDKRTPSREDIRWQVFTNLAFGVKGLQYFCYFTPDKGNESFTPALITTDGQKTERFDYVKEINTEIAAYGDKLLNCHAEGVILNNNSDEERYQLYDESLVSFGKLLSVEGDTALVGCFTDRITEKKSILITGTNPREDINITLSFARGVKSVEAYVNGEIVKMTVTDGKLELTIQRGDAIYVLI
jgi:hypothetical protein